MIILRGFVGPHRALRSLAIVARLRALLSTVCRSASYNTASEGVDCTRPAIRRAASSWTFSSFLRSVMPTQGIQAGDPYSSTDRHIATYVEWRRSLVQPHSVDATATSILLRCLHLSTVLRTCSLNVSLLSKVTPRNVGNLLKPSCLPFMNTCGIELASAASIEKRLTSHFSTLRVINHWSLQPLTASSPC